MKALLLSLSLLSSSPAPADFSPAGFAVVNRSPQVVLVLQKLRGHCPENTKRMYLIGTQGGEVYAGCYMVHEQKVIGVFEDGDTVDIPVDAITWLKTNNL